MKIHLQNIGRRYNREWIFKSFNHTFQAGDRFAVLGPNGSGKSTFLKVLSGYLTPSEGAIDYYIDNKQVAVDSVFSSISIAAPYIELIEDFSLLEMINFHFQFKTIVQGYTPDSIIDYLQLHTSADKPIKYYSSGMKQRVKLALACFSQCHLLLLDEPTSNLDDQGVLWYKSLIDLLVDDNKIMIIGSNQPHEYDFCDQRIHILDYKTRL